MKLTPGHIDRREVIGLRTDPAEFRSKVLDLVEDGRSVAEVPEQLGVSTWTIHNRRNPDMVDRGPRPV
ncbi:MAG: hypothetical protein F4X49_12655 [Acidimicrobiia bacterium]|nr:hypothetical protein [Acidimicrobiia bacterium]